MMSAAIEPSLDALDGARVFFAHQSVGENILAGLGSLLEGTGRTLPIVALSEGTRPAGTCLLHARVGRNQDPLSKCDEFRSLVDGELRGHIDIAILKFCYIDINARTDVTRLFDAYRSTLDDLASRHPAITFVAATAPLRHSAGGVGVLARELLGRPNHSKLGNLTRQAFNDQVRRAYAERPLFDLAASESTHPDGRRERFTYGGKTGDNLVGAYTNDGGHLNETGRRAVAADFVAALASAARVQTSAR